MPHGLLMPECVVHADGCGPALELGPGLTGRVQVVLHVTHTVSRECLVVGILGSPDGVHWSTRPLAEFPQNCFNGDYDAWIDLRGTDVHYLRAEWTVKRWERSEAPALFGFSIELLAESAEPAMAAGGR